MMQSMYPSTKMQVSFFNTCIFALSSPYSTLLLSYKGVLGVLIYFANPSFGFWILDFGFWNILPPKPITEPWRSATGNIMRDLNRSYVFPSEYTSIPPLPISSLEYPLLSKNSHNPRAESGAYPSLHFVMLSCVTPLPKRYCVASLPARERSE